MINDKEPIKKKMKWTGVPIVRRKAGNAFPELELIISDGGFI